MGLFGASRPEVQCPLEAALGFNLWLVGQDRPREQRARYRRGLQHTQKMPPELCRRILTHLRLPEGSLVGDCFMGIGTTAVEARLMGLRFVGCDIEGRWLADAAENLRALEADGPIEPQGERPYWFWQGRAQELDHLGDASVDAWVFSPPFGRQDPLRDSSGRPIRQRALAGEPYARYLLHSSAYRQDGTAPAPGSMSGQGGLEWDASMLAALREMRRTVRPGGWVVAVLREIRTDAGMLDLPGRVMQMAPQARLIVHDQVYAVEAALDRFGALTSRAGVFQHTMAKRQQRDGRAAPLGVPCITRVVMLRRRERP